MDNILAAYAAYRDCVYVSSSYRLHMHTYHTRADPNKAAMRAHILLKIDDFFSLILHRYIK